MWGDGEHSPHLTVSRPVLAEPTPVKASTKHHGVSLLSMDRYILGIRALQLVMSSKQEEPIAAKAQLQNSELNARRGFHSSCLQLEV